jgi:S-adenosylmethionine:tRNA ribosyltransferase-isomerase
VFVSEFDYQLPEDLIAQQPPADRAGSRMLHLVRPGQDLEHFATGPALASARAMQTGGHPAPASCEDRLFRNFPELLRPGDLVVFNNTRVFPARLYGHRSGSRAQPLSPHNPASREFLHGRIEVLLTRQLPGQPTQWEALVRPGRKIGVGERLYFGENDELQAEVVARGTFGERTLRFDPVVDFFAAIERIGHVPLPPYITRADSKEDRERYQTVFARERGSVGAPTAGLHFSQEILDRLRRQGVETAEITLHVGLGTFQPVRVERVEDHKLHRERYSISPVAAEAINRAMRDQRRIIAIGTTTVRTLESCALRTGGTIEAGAGEADIFICPGFRFRVVNALLTNFHLPQSTLLMLVCAFAGRDRILRAYEHAVRQRYRFYSYGDCMFIE